MSEYIGREKLQMVIPCKVGDTVWTTTRVGLTWLEMWTVTKIYKPRNRGWRVSLRSNESITCERAISEFGKTIFLTKDDAEKALE